MADDMEESEKAKQQKLNELNQMKSKFRKNLLDAKANGDLEKVAEEMENLFSVFISKTEI